MSPSPTDATDRAGVSQYANAWRAIIEMVRRGDSWSGRERNCVFLNLGSAESDAGKPGTATPDKISARQFVDISAVSGLDFPDDGRAVAVTDWDQDGDLDLWLYNRTGPRLRLMLNRTSTPDRDADFVALRLEGDGSNTNRDAIGAVVELSLVPSTDEDKGNRRQLVKTLRAGEGFLSQNSKWLHFGLGATRSIQEVKVHWPGGRSERFSEIEPGHRYLLRQGSGKAAPWVSGVGTTRRIRLKAIPKPPELPTVSLASILPGKIPLPELAYLDRDGQRHLIEPGSRPLLVLFWASWCHSCLHELQHLTSAASRLEEAGLDVLALSLDHVDSAVGGEDLSAEKVLKRTGFPFQTAWADRDTLRSLELLQEALFELHPEPVVPMACLLDGQRRLVALYRGPVQAARLLHDLAAADTFPDQQRDLSVPFGGRWYTQAITPDELAAFAGRQLVARHPLEAAGHFERAARLAAGTARQQHLADTAFMLLYNLARLSSNSADEADQLYERAVALKPDSSEAFHDWGVLLARQGKRQQAEAKLRRALEIQPDHDLARQNLERLLQ